MSRRPITRVAVLLTVAMAAVVVPGTALAGDPGTPSFPPSLPPVHTLSTVIINVQELIMGVLAAVATLFLVLAGVYWTTAGGDPAQVDRAKAALRNALIGYALAVLAPMLLEIVKHVVGG